MTSSLKPPPEDSLLKVEVDSLSPDLSGGQTVTGQVAQRKGQQFAAEKGSVCCLCLEHMF